MSSTVVNLNVILDDDESITLMSKFIDSLGIYGVFLALSCACSRRSLEADGNNLKRLWNERAERIQEFGKVATGMEE